MSVVTNVILSAGPGDDTAIAPLNRALIDAGIPALRNIGDDHNSSDPYDRTEEYYDEHARWGGTKAPEATLYGGAYNFLDVEQFLRTVEAQPWRARSDLQVFLKEQQDDRWTVLDYTGIVASIAERAR